MTYTAWSVVYGEKPSAAKWNQLGENDAGFRDGSNFNDSIISTAKVIDEAITSRKLAPTVIIETCTGNVTINSTSDTDITGCTSTFTPDIDCYAKVTAIVDFASASTVNDVFVIELDVDGVDEANFVTYGVPTSAGRFTVSQVWLVALTAASHTLKLQGRRNSGTGTCVVQATHTRLMIEIIGNNNVTNS